MADDLALNRRTGSLPPYRRVIQAIEEAVEQGRYAAGDRLPNLKEMAEQLGVHFLTVRKAMLELSHRGIVEMHVGVGTFIRSQPARQKVVRLAAVYSDMLIKGVRGSHPGPSVLMDGLHRRSDSAGSVVQAHFYRNGHFVEDIGEQLLASGVNGLIHFGPSEYEHFYKFCEEHRLPLVEFSNYAEPHGWATVVQYDWAAAIQQGIEHLRALGHQRIAYVNYRRVMDGTASHEHFVRMARSVSYDPRSSMVLASNSPASDVVWPELDTFFELNPTPTAVIVGEEYIANWLLDGCIRRGIRVPEDLSVLAMLDLWRHRPGGDLTTTFPYEVIRDSVSYAADLLLRRIHGETLDSVYTVPPRLVAGSTTARIQGN